MQYANPRKSKPARTRLTTDQQAAVRRGYRAQKPRRGASWEYDLGAEIKAAGEELDYGLLIRGYYPYSTGRFENKSRDEVDALLNTEADLVHAADAGTLVRKEIPHTMKTGGSSRLSE